MAALFVCVQGLEASAQDMNEMTYSPNETVFKLHAPANAKRVLVKIYANGLDGKPLKTLKMKFNGNNQWTATAKGDFKGRFYTFDIPAFNRGETPGIFAKAVGVNGRRGAIINLEETNPKGWETDKRPPLASPADLVIYELHHRDFSVHPSSGIKNKGKFLALTEDKAIKHLQQLGINAVHILPSFDYASIDETQLHKPQYNWGYDPLNYNVPEGSYSTDPYRPDVRIREFKQMVQALHKAGIRVILDVVYNHTYDLSGSAFQRTWPDYFYRKRTDGTYSDGSGCGNETASEQPLMRQFMIESMKHWVKEYHIDGFRVDHGKRARQAEAHGAGLGVRFRPELGGAAAEHLRFRVEFDVHLQPERRVVVLDDLVEVHQVRHHHTALVPSRGFARLSSGPSSLSSRVDSMKPPTR